MTVPTKAESEAIKRNDDTIPFEVVQAALDRHILAEAELAPFERTLLHIKNTAENLWKNAPPMPKEGITIDKWPPFSTVPTRLVLFDVFYFLRGGKGGRF